MKRMNPLRAALAVAALAAAPVAHADVGGITTTGWLSVGGVFAVTGILYWLHKKVN